MKKLIVFDLDGTLAESKSSLDAEMAALLAHLLSVSRVAVISGGDWPQFQSQVLAVLARDERLKRLSLLPACGTKFYRYEGGWERLYCDDLAAGEKEKIVAALKRAAVLAELEIGRTWGEQIEDRGSQITFSALGQRAPLEAKKSWDPGFAKRKAMLSFLETMIPEFSVRMGGATSVDVTKRGVDKAYGLGRLRDVLGIGIAEMLFIGDALFPGGNDYPAVESGAACIQVQDPDESKGVIEAIAASFVGRRSRRR